MNKTTAILINCLLFSFMLKSQSHYVCPHFSYALGTNPMYYSTNNNVTKIGLDTAFTEFTYIGHHFSLGGGKSYGATYGLNINDVLTFELAFAYFSGNENKVNSSSRIELYPYSIYNITFKYTDIFTYNSFSLTPSFLLTAKRRKMTPYIGFGLHLAYSQLKEKQHVTIHNNIPGYIPTERYEYTYIQSPRFILGWHKTIGVEFLSFKLVNFFIEFQHLNLNATPKKKDCVEFTYQGEDNMDDLTNWESSIYYVESYNPKDFDKNKTGKQLQMKFTMNSIALRGGIRYYFK